MNKWVNDNIILRNCQPGTGRRRADILDDIGDRLKKFRQRMGYTQKQISDLLNIERSTYSYYETGKTTPDIMTICKLADIFNEKISDILEGEISPVPKEKDSEVMIFPSEHSALLRDSEVYRINDFGPQFTSDLSDSERDMVLCFRLLSSKRQKKISDMVREQLESMGL